jgi:hypothetical protein
MAQPFPRLVDELFGALGTDPGKLRHGPIAIHASLYPGTELHPTSRGNSRDALEYGAVG